jgi:lipoyl(octanoyl) transferase
MTWSSGQLDPDATVAQFHLLGLVDFESALALQQRLVYEAGESRGRQITVLLCEHPDVLTIGRDGSRSHIRLDPRELKRRRLPVRWVGRGGGCILHAPGQLAVYPIVPLEPFDWSVGDYLQRLRQGISSTFEALGINGETRPHRLGIWGRKGQLAAFGVAVRNWISYHGAFINVNPAMNPFGYIDTGLRKICRVNGPNRGIGMRGSFTDAANTGESSGEPVAGHGRGTRPTMSCLLAETGRGVTMPRVRAQLIASLSEAFGCDRHHLHTGHSLLASLNRSRREPIARAS